MIPWKVGSPWWLPAMSRAETPSPTRHGEPHDLGTADELSEGIELLLMERSNATPEQNFGPGWFWPALTATAGSHPVLATSFVVQRLPWPTRW